MQLKPMKTRVTGENAIDALESVCTGWLCRILVKICNEKWNLEYRVYQVAPAAYFDIKRNHSKGPSQLFSVEWYPLTYLRERAALIRQYKLGSPLTADLQNMGTNRGALALFTNESGGILDDLIVNKVSETELYIVSNASMADQDWKILSGYVFFNFGGIFAPPNFRPRECSN